MTNIITRHIDATTDEVWAVLDDFGGIAKWNPAVKRSAQTSEGDVGKGTTRHCDLSPIGGVNERIETYVPKQRMTVSVFETFKMPINTALADITLAAHDGGTTVTIEFDYTPNRLGRVASGTIDKQMRKGFEGLADALKQTSESVGVI